MRCIFTLATVFVFAAGCAATSETERQKQNQIEALRTELAQADAERQAARQHVREYEARVLRADQQLEKLRAEVAAQRAQLEPLSRAHDPEWVVAQYEQEVIRKFEANLNQRLSEDFRDPLVLKVSAALDESLRGGPDKLLAFVTPPDLDQATRNELSSTVTDMYMLYFGVMPGSPAPRERSWERLSERLEALVQRLRATSPDHSQRLLLMHKTFDYDMQRKNFIESRADDPQRAAVYRDALEASARAADARAEMQRLDQVLAQAHRAPEEARAALRQARAESGERQQRFDQLEQQFLQLTHR